MATQMYDTTVWLISTDRDTMLDNFYNCFSTYDPRFTQESGTKYVVFDNRIKIDVVAGSSIRYLDMNDNVIITAGNFSNRNQSELVRIIITDHSFYATVCQNSQWGYTFFIYESSSTITYLALYLNTNYALDNSNYIYRFDSNGLLTTSGFSIVKICTTQLSSPYILFSTTCAIITTAGSVGLLPDFRSCSLVTRYSTVTVNNKNYLAIGTNTLVEAPAS